MQRERAGSEALKYRHEWKHELNRLDLLTIRQRLRAVMEPDPHASDGSYFIRSLYFDNLRDKALREKLDGVNMREKFRIRYYNGDPSVIHLEKKSKRGSLGTKYSAPLAAEEVRRILEGDLAWMLESPHSLVQELYCKMLDQGLRPAGALYLRSGQRPRDPGLRYPHKPFLRGVSRPGLSYDPGG